MVSIRLLWASEDATDVNHKKGSPSDLCALAQSIPPVRRVLAEPSTPLRTALLLEWQNHKGNQLAASLNMYNHQY